MVNEIKKSKVESLVEEINNKHKEDAFDSIYENELLRLVFNYDELNDFGKIIIEGAKFRMPNSDNLRRSVKLDKTFEKPEKRKILIREWVDYCRKNNYLIKEEFYFILFALLVVTVDKTNKEEHLSIICDFARMLMITDDEMEDIVEIIKIIYDKSDSEVLSQHYTMLTSLSEEYDNARMKKCKELDKHIKSNRILESFSKLIESYVGIDGKNVLWYREFGRLK